LPIIFDFGMASSYCLLAWCIRPRLWRDRYMVWEVAVGRGCGVAGRGWTAVWHGSQGSTDYGHSWPVAKSSTKVLNAKEKHKFV
jgi:hypothetical protein